jgi:hypothetical protein
LREHNGCRKAIRSRSDDAGALRRSSYSCGGSSSGICTALNLPSPAGVNIGA